MIVVGSINDMSTGERLNCCQQPAATLGVDGVEVRETITPAFPDSLFLSDEELKEKVNECRDLVRLRALYRDNYHRVEQKPELRQLFACRTAELEI